MWKNSLLLSLSPLKMCLPFIAPGECARALKVNTSSIRRTRHVCSVTKPVKISELLPSSVSPLSLSWPIWHRGWLCKALRAWQRAIHLRSKEPLPRSSVMPWELSFGAFLLVVFVCIWAKIKADYPQVCKQVEGRCWLLPWYAAPTQELYLENRKTIACWRSFFLFNKSCS